MEQISNETLAVMIQDIKCDVVEIKQQTVKTNGRVTSLEKWQWTVIGGVAAVSTLFPFAVWFLSRIGK